LASGTAWSHVSRLLGSVLGSGTPAALKWSAKTTPTTARALPIITPSGYITANTLTRYTTLRYDATDGDPELRQPGRRAILPGGGRRLKGVGWANVARVAARKLDMLDYAAVRTDLASPPGNRIEALKGSLRGFHSIRINDQWRIVFRWIDSGSAEVDIRDYH
jgi:proteic killer suppression protein